VAPSPEALRSLASAMGNQRFARLVEGRSPALIAREPAAAAAPDRAQDSQRLKALLPRVEASRAVLSGAGRGLHQFGGEALGTVDQIAAVYADSADVFKRAYKQHTNVLEAENERAADWASTRDAILGVMIGVAAAYTAVPLLEDLVKMLKVLAPPITKVLTEAGGKVLTETGGEVAEFGASKVKEAVAGDDAPGRPEALTPDAMELKQSRDLVELYRRLAKLHVDSDVGGLSAACDRLVIEIERFDDGRSRLSPADIEAAATALEAKQPEAAKVQAAIAQVQADLATRLNDVRMRRTLSDGPEVLKDIWTRWLAANPGRGSQGLIREEVERLGLLHFYPGGFGVEAEGGGPSQAAEAREQRGKRGSAATDLKPMGEALVDGRPWMATTHTGGTIAAGTPIRVIGLQPMRGPDEHGEPPQGGEEKRPILIVDAMAPEPNASLPEPDHSEG
jgi:hypothetical protein